jgi:hypothetical protein
MAWRNFEIGRILHLKSEIRNFEIGLSNCEVRFAILNFGFEMQDSSNFKFLHSNASSMLTPFGRGIRLTPPSSSTVLA